MKIVPIDGCAYRRSRPPVPTDRDQLFRSIATRAARVLTAPLGDGCDVSPLWLGQGRREVVPVVNRRARARRGAPYSRRGGARGRWPVDPRGRPGSSARRSLRISWVLVGQERLRSGYLFRRSRLGLGLHGGFKFAKGWSV